MRILLLILLVPFASGVGQLPSYETTAAGTASYHVTSSTGATLCNGSAAYAIHTELNGATGVIAWDAPLCVGLQAAGATPYFIRCIDACFQDCEVTREELRCHRGIALDESWTEFTLRRDGTFTFHRETPDATIDGSGVLTVARWPNA